MEAFNHLSPLSGRIALSQGELSSQTCCLVPYKITPFCQTCFRNQIGSFFHFLPFLQSKQPPPFDLPQLSPHWLVENLSDDYEIDLMLIINQLIGVS